MTVATNHSALVRTLHWTVAVLLIAIIAAVAGGGFDGDGRAASIPVHASFGALTLVLTLIWLLARRRAAALAPRGSVRTRKLSRLVHRALFALILLQAALGLLMAASQAFGVRLFNGPDIAALLPADRGLIAAVLPVHGLIAMTLIALSAAHAFAGLWHAIVRRDDVLKRMLPFADLYHRTVGAGRTPGWRFPSRAKQSWPKGRLP